MTRGGKLLPLYLVFILALLLLTCSTSLSLKAKWTAYGKKPAPYSKRYRDKHGIKTPGDDNKHESTSEPPSNTKMLLFFGSCIGLYLFWSRPSGGSSSSSSSSRRSNSNTTRTVAMPGSVNRPSLNSRIIDDTSSSVNAARRARLARLKRFSEDGVNKNKKAMKDALETASGDNYIKSNNKIIGDDGNAMRKRKSANRKKTFGTIYSLNGNMDKESDKNKYDGGSGTMYEGRDD